MEEVEEGKSIFFEEPRFAYHTFTYQLENILFIKKTGAVIFSGFANTPKFLR